MWTLYILIAIMIFIIISTFYSIINHSTTLDKKTEMSMDFQACEQMRESGWTEEEIQDFMHHHKGYYDVDWGEYKKSF